MPENHDKSNSIGHKNYAVAVENTLPYNTTRALDCFVVNMYLKYFLSCKCITVFWPGTVKYRFSLDSSQMAEVIELLKLYPLSGWYQFSQLIGSKGENASAMADHHYRYRRSALWWPKDRTVNRNMHSCPTSHPMALALLPCTCLVVYLFLWPSSLCTCPFIWLFPCLLTAHWADRIVDLHKIHTGENFPRTTTQWQTSGKEKLFNGLDLLSVS